VHTLSEISPSGLHKFGISRNIGLSEPVNVAEFVLLQSQEYPDAYGFFETSKH
jgi:hypothetical protein